MLKQYKPNVEDDEGNLIEWSDIPEEIRALLPEPTWYKPWESTLPIVEMGRYKYVFFAGRMWSLGDPQPEGYPVHPCSTLETQRVKVTLGLEG